MIYKIHLAPAIKYIQNERRRICIQMDGYETRGCSDCWSSSDVNPFHELAMDFLLKKTYHCLFFFPFQSSSQSLRAQSRLKSRFRLSRLISVAACCRISSPPHRQCAHLTGNKPTAPAIRPPHRQSAPLTGNPPTTQCKQRPTFQFQGGWKKR